MKEYIDKELVAEVQDKLRRAYDLVMRAEAITEDAINIIDNNIELMGKFNDDFFIENLKALLSNASIKFDRELRHSAFKYKEAKSSALQKRLNQLNRADFNKH